jgi:hypothetical protein
MRLTLALVVAVIVAACAIEQSGAEHNFVYGDGAREAQAELDARAIQRGMEQARDDSQRVARDTRQTAPGTAPAALTR